MTPINSFTLRYNTRERRLYQVAVFLGVIAKALVLVSLYLYYLNTQLTNELATYKEQPTKEVCMETRLSMNKNESMILCGPIVNNY